MLLDALASITPDESRCVLLRGEGKDFCAGADFSDVASSAASGARYGAGFERLLHAIEDHPLPLVVEVKGAALGAGCQLLAAADLAVAATDARIGIPSAKIGILLDLEKIQRMVRVLGPARAREMLLTGRAISGTEAVAWGLATKAVATEDIEAATRALAEEVADNAPLSVRGSKAGIRAVLRHGALDRETDAGAFAPHDEATLRAVSSSDVAEGLAARKDKRRPQFRGE